MVVTAPEYVKSKYKLHMLKEVSLRMVDTTLVS